MATKIDIILYDSQRPKSETIESAETAGLKTPENPIRHTTIGSPAGPVDPVSLEYIGVLIPFDKVQSAGVENGHISIGDALKLIAYRQLPANWKKTDDQRLYATNAGFLVIFARMLWTYETLDLDLSVLKE